MSWTAFVYFFFTATNLKCDWSKQQETFTGSTNSNNYRKIYLRSCIIYRGKVSVYGYIIIIYKKKYFLKRSSANVFLMGNIYWFMTHFLEKRVDKLTFSGKNLNGEKPLSEKNQLNDFAFREMQKYYGLIILWNHEKLESQSSYSAGNETHFQKSRTSWSPPSWWYAEPQRKCEMGILHEPNFWC